MYTDIEEFACPRIGIAQKLEFLQHKVTGVYLELTPDPALNLKSLLLNLLGREGGKRARKKQTKNSVVTASALGYSQY